MEGGRRGGGYNGHQENRCYSTGGDGRALKGSKFKCIINHYFRNLSVKTSRPATDTAGERTEKLKRLIPPNLFSSPTNWTGQGRKRALKTGKLVIFIESPI